MPVRAAVQHNAIAGFEPCDDAAQRDAVQLAGCWVAVDEAGTTGVGRVWRAWHDHLDRLASVLTLEISSQIQIVERFQRAAGVWSRLTHPGVARVLATGRFRSWPAIMVEWMDGGSLDDVLRQHGPLSSDVVADAGAAVARALEAAHHSGLTHGDLHAGNILWNREGVVKVSGFCLGAVRAAAMIEADAKPFLQPPFRAPEQTAGGEVGPHTDMWLLGATLYHLLTGTLPPADGPLPDAGRLAPHVPPAMSTLLQRMADPLPGRRPQSMAEIEPILQRMAVEPTSASASRPTTRIGAGMIGGIEVVELPVHPEMRDWIDLQVLMSVLHEEGTTRFVLDLEHCQSLAGSNASALSQVQQATGGRARIILAGVPARARIALDLLGVTGFMPMAPDVDAAVKLLGGGNVRRHHLREEMREQS